MSCSRKDVRHKMSRSSLFICSPSVCRSCNTRAGGFEDRIITVWECEQYLQSGRRLLSCRPRSSWLTVSRQCDAGDSSYDDVTGRHSICRRRTACLEQPSCCHTWSVTVAVNLRKAAENLFVCLRVAALVTYELAPWKCTDWLTN